MMSQYKHEKRRQFCKVLFNKCIIGRGQLEIIPYFKIKLLQKL